MVLAHFLVPGDRLTIRRFGGIVLAYAGVLALFVGRSDVTDVTLLGDGLVVASAVLL